ncbi:ABC transporter ATP-binding protein [Chamaesiphon polymorphus]|uniref:ABC transporter ATP-binding protein n=1 Tax=Chamaesiphon polymorphus TaxID=2107691 RepID=UPI001C629EBB|nr:ABC transporter ATP-binding protein [Chamaesiphon polymorphus]
MKSLVVNLQRALHLVWHSSPRWTVVSLGLLLFQGFLPLGQLYLMKQLIDTLTLGVKSGFDASTWQTALIWIGGVGVLTLASDTCNALNNLTQTIQTQAISDRVHSLLHHKSIEVDLQFYENTDYYNTLHRAQEQAPYRPQMVLYSLLQVGQSSLSLLGILVLLTGLHWLVPLVLLLAILPGVAIRFKYTGKAYLRISSWTESERQADYLHTLVTTEPYAKEIRLFALGSLFHQWFQGLRTKIRQEKVHLATQQSAIDLITNGSATLAVCIASGITAYQMIQGAVTLGGFVMYYQAFQRGQGFLRDLLSNSIGLYENSLFLQDFYQFLDIQPLIVAPVAPKPLPAVWQQGICLENVSFNYAHSQRSVLKNINLKINAGEVIAIVGANGAGKTTLIKLLCRLYDPTEGTISIDGVDLRHYAPTDIQRQISVLFQDYIQYQLTVQENIWLGNIEAPPSTEAIWDAARAAGADPTIERLPQGLDTRLGNWFEQGEELSIGQWQKIALARAFMRDAQLVILDEPTSALDPQAEAEVFDRFRQLVRGRTAIVISHRLSTIKMVDRILVLSNGELVECGSHDRLMEQNGLYARLFNTQAQHYQV